MARMRDAFGRVLNYKTAICPLCGASHNVKRSGWLIPAKKRIDKDGNQQGHDGLETGFYCRTENDAVIKQYTDEYKYIGYYIDREIPF